MNHGLRILYVAPWVLGDPGANAADIFPRLSVAHPDIDKTLVADFPKNKFHIETRQGATYLRLEWRRSMVRYAARIAWKAKQENIDVIHVFYRQQNAVLLVLIRIFLILLRAHTRILMDHRSVNLAKGWRRTRKVIVNFVMQAFCHHLAGNPWAVETNHLRLFRPKTIIDLGYDTEPDPVDTDVISEEAVNVWFIGSLKPKNRKSDFLLDIFDRIDARQNDPLRSASRKIRIHVAGTASESQKARLVSNAAVTFHGMMPRPKLYQCLANNPGIGLAYMNTEFHAYAPSLKFSEYAMMRFRILASDTLGLRTQADRMVLPSTIFVPEDEAEWVNAIQSAADTYQGPEPAWADAKNWSYSSIFERQVVRLYRHLAYETHIGAGMDAPYQNKKSAS